METSGEAPLLKDLLTDKEITDGESLTFSVTLDKGSEPMEITWYHDNCEIKDSPAFRYGREEGRISLTIADAFPEDSGIYSCNVSNKYGRAETGCVLTVKGEMDCCSVPISHYFHLFVHLRAACV